MTFRRAKVGSLLLSACAGTILPFPHHTLAQPAAATPAPPPGMTPASITGRDFAGLRFPLAPTAGPISFAARKVQSWSEPSQAGQAPLQRLFLAGDVRVRLGLYDFDAANAVVWLQKVENSLTPGSPGIYQVFVYFDRLGDPTADAQNSGAISVSADRLPVRGMIEATGPIDLKADLLTSGRPNDALINEGEAALGKLLRSLAGFPDPAPADEDALPVSARGVRTPIRIVPDVEPAQEIVRADPKPAERREPVSPSTPPPRREPRPDTPVAARPPAQQQGQPSQPTRPSEAPTQVARTPSGEQPTQPAQAQAEPVAPIPGTTRPFRPSAEATPADQITDLLKTLPPADPSQPIFAKQGLFAVDAPEVDRVSGENETAIIFKGGVTVQYTNLKTLDTLSMSAQRVVLFLEPGSVLETFRNFNPEQIRGVYLEGDVVASSTRGENVLKQYTLRGPQMYYNVQRNRAIVLDGVFWTYDAPRRLPLYLRANVIRQEADNQFSADKARVANTAFFEPELAIGASSLTITRIPREDSGGGVGDGTGGAGSGVASSSGGASTRSSVYLDARDITLRSSEFPFFYFPAYIGDPASIPIKDVRVENSSGSGSAIKTTWNGITLLGLDQPKEFDADLMLDAYFERGFATGTLMEWGEPGGRGPYKGGLFGYLIVDDTGTDVLKPGTKIERDGGTRGMILAENRWKLDERWTLFTDGAYIGDETFVDAFFEPLGETRREFTNRAFARRLENNTALTLEAKGEFDDFLANEYLLQSQGYQTDKLPELAYFRQSDDVLGGVAPGLLSYTSDYRLGRLSMNFDKPTAAEHGFTSDFLAQRALGVNRNESVADRLRAQGYQEDGVYRADTRQEISSQLAAGPINFTPFAVGRITAYDNDFQALSPNEDDNARLWGGVGARASTTIQRVDDSVDSALLDLHRMRHIIEPGVTVMQSGTNVDSKDLPLYDDTVEGINDGLLARFGINQTWQTKRGGPGRWHNVDVFKLNTEAVLVSDDMDRESPIGRFYDFRPEYSVPANFLNIDGLWQVSEVVAIAGGNVYDFDLNQQARSNIGVLFEHSPAFRTWADLRYVNSQDSTFIILGTTYEIEKYIFGVTTNYDASEGGFQSYNFDIRRKSAAAMLGFSISYNDVSGETSFGFLLQPLGVQGGGARLRGLGAPGDRSQTSDFGGG